MVFADEANNQAYLYAINQLLPHIQFGYDGRITKAVVLKELPHLPTDTLNAIIALKKACFFDFIHLTKVNFYLLNGFLLDNMGFLGNNTLYLTSCGDRSRVRQVLKYHKLDGFFDNIICNERKFETVCNFVQNIDRIKVYDNDIQQLTLAYQLGFKKSNLFLVDKEIVSGLALGCDTIAHDQALRTKTNVFGDRKGTTIAILPSTLANITPIRFKSANYYRKLSSCHY
ncbi:DNA-processing protein DprA [Moraxella macacae]|uniref:DNA-processing protein DprA n=1 Tax=Moraxella macacae TaxID=765840 RepID=UPI001D0D6FCE|nr:DNA-processing protein DprA [Moraxella macacae]